MGCHLLVLLLLNGGFEYDHDLPNRGPSFLMEPSTYMDGPSEEYVGPLKRVTMRNLCRRDCAEETLSKLRSRRDALEEMVEEIVSKRSCPSYALEETLPKRRSLH